MKTEQYETQLSTEEKQLVDVISDAHAQGEPGVFGMEAAEAINLQDREGKLQYQLANKVLSMVGINKQTERFFPIPSIKFYPNAHRLEGRGILGSDRQPEQKGAPRRRVYWLAKNPDTLDV